MAKGLSNKSGLPQGLTKVKPRMKASGSNFKQGKVSNKNGTGPGGAVGSASSPFSPRFTKETKGRSDAYGKPPKMPKRGLLG